MRLPRLRVRTLMVVVAVAGLVARGERERAAYRREAEYHGYHLQNYHSTALVEGKAARKALTLAVLDPTRRQEYLGLAEWSLGLKASCIRRMPYHSGLARKYRVLSLLPWLPVPPDPPPPE